MVLMACQPTRYVPKGERLLKKSSIELEQTPYIKSSEIEGYLKQKPNTRILGIIPFHLMSYNALNMGRERKWKTKLKTVIGEEPVIYDSLLTEKSVKQISQFLKNKGFYESEIRYTDRGKKVRLNYQIRLNKPIRLGEIYWQIQDSLLREIVLSDALNSSLLKTGGIFDADLLEAERQRIVKMLRNSGYYGFIKESVDYLVDTTIAPYVANIYIRFNQPGDNNPGSINIRKHRIHNLLVVLDQPGIVADSIRNSTVTEMGDYDTTYLFNGEEPSLKRETIFSRITFRPGEIYSMQKVEDTYRQLSALQQFRYINIQFIRSSHQSIDSLPGLDAVIQLSSQDAQSYQIEFEGTNSENHWGLGGNLLYRHKNVYRGAEIFDIRMSGALEFQRNVILLEESDRFLNGYWEFGLESKLLIPDFWLPFHIRLERFQKRYYPKTNFSVNFNNQRRPSYTRKLLNGAYGYRWSGNTGSTHLLNPVELNIIMLSDTTSEFSQYFDTLYLRHSYESQFIQAASYSFQYSSQDLKRRKDFHYFRWNAEMAGNMLKLTSDLVGRQKNDAGYYEIFSIPFAQFVKSDFEYRYYHYHGVRSLIVYRAYFGIGIPYGNAEVLPFVKKYYSGGPNSIRAWTVRSLGPGSFVDDSSFPDLASDMKLEMNVEYRFDIFWKLKGAVFLDAGNIWAINRYDERKGALFKPDQFVREIAIGTGMGARFDFDFILFRIDLGIKLRDPERVPDKRWVLSNWHNGDPLFAWNIGIGYPF
jgi:hypothetical protein